MGDTPEVQAAKDALAIVGQWKQGKADLLSPRTPAQAAAGIGMEEGLAGLWERKRRGLGEAALPFVLGTGGAIGLGLAGGPLGAVAGGGAGSAAGEALNPLMFKLLGLQPPASMTGSRVADAALMGVGGAAGEGLGLGASAVGRAVMRPMTPAPAAGAARLRQQFADVGGGSRMTPVDLNLADVSPNMAALERSVAQTPTGGNIIRAAADRRAGQLSKAADDFLDRVAPASAGERVAVGEKASAAITRNVERTGALEDALWTQMSQMASDLPVNIRGLKAAAGDVLLTEQRGLKPNANLVTLAEKIIKHADEVPWQVADAWRKEFGRNIKSGELISGLPSGENKLLYRSLLNDMEGAAGASDVVGLAGGYKNLRTFSEHRRAIFRDGEVAKILETDPEQVVTMLNLAGGPSAITRAREGIMGSGALGAVAPTAADREAWDFVRRHVLEGVFQKATNPEYKGLANPVIVGSRLDKALKTLGDDGLKELLSDTERKALDNLVAVAKAMRSSEKIGALPGTSTTPQGMGFAELFKSPGVLLGTALGGLTGGPGGAAVGGAAGGFASFILIPQLAARMLTHPQAAAIVASPAFAGLANVTKGGAAVARAGSEALFRLGGILFAESQGGE